MSIIDYILFLRDRTNETNVRTIEMLHAGVFQNRY